MIGEQIASIRRTEPALNHDLNSEFPSLTTSNHAFHDRNSTTVGPQLAQAPSSEDMELARAAL